MIRRRRRDNNLSLYQLVKRSVNISPKLWIAPYEIKKGQQIKRTTEKKQLLKEKCLQKPINYIKVHRTVELKSHTLHRLNRYGYNRAYLYFVYHQMDDSANAVLDMEQAKITEANKMVGLIKGGVNHRAKLLTDLLISPPDNIGDIMEICGRLEEWDLFEIFHHLNLMHRLQHPK